MTLKQPPSEAQMLSALERGQVELAPLRLAGVRRGSSVQDKRIDAIARLKWKQKTYVFLIECKTSSFPKAVDDASRQARAAVAAMGGMANPLVLVPYLSEEQLTRLEREQISGLDLCGNGLVIVPGELLVKRSGQPNRFAREGGIKNIYRGVSSLVARVFLLERDFDSLDDLRRAIVERGGDVALATISKVTKALENDLVIERSKGKGRRTRRVRLIQPEKLLDRLVANFVPPQAEDTTRGKLEISTDELARRARGWRLTNGERLIRTGADSVGSYATMAREPVRRFYCTNLARLRDDLGRSFRPAERFAEIEFQQTDDETVYFDGRAELDASPIQTYLELMAGDKRDQETAAQVRHLILNPPG